MTARYAGAAVPVGRSPVLDSASPPSVATSGPLSSFPQRVSRSAISPPAAAQASPHQIPHSAEACAAWGPRPRQGALCLEVPAGPEPRAGKPADPAAPCARRTPRAAPPQRAAPPTRIPLPAERLPVPPPGLGACAAGEGPRGGRGGGGGALSLMGCNL